MDTDTPYIDPLLPPERAAGFLDTISWLAKARMTGGGPEFVKIGRAIRYPMSGLQKFIQARVRKSTRHRAMTTNHAKPGKNQD